MDALCNNVQYDFFFKCYADHRYLHVRTHSCPTRRSSDLCALGGEDDIIAKFLKKILYVGAFALILNNFQSLSEIIFRSFAGLGLTAGASAIGACDLLLPGRLGGLGLEGASPLLDSAQGLVGPPASFERFVEIYVLLDRTSAV